MGNAFDMESVPRKVEPQGAKMAALQGNPDAIEKELLARYGTYFESKPMHEAKTLQKLMDQFISDEYGYNYSLFGAYEATSSFESKAGSIEAFRQEYDAKRAEKEWMPSLPFSDGQIGRVLKGKGACEFSADLGYVLLKMGDTAKIFDSELAIDKEKLGLLAATGKGKVEFSKESINYSIEKPGEKFVLSEISDHSIEGDLKAAKRDDYYPYYSKILDLIGEASRQLEGIPFENGEFQSKAPLLNLASDVLFLGASYVAKEHDEGREFIRRGKWDALGDFMGIVMQAGIDRAMHDYENANVPLAFIDAKLPRFGKKAFALDESLAGDRIIISNEDRKRLMAGERICGKNSWGQSPMALEYDRESGKIKVFKRVMTQTIMSYKRGLGVLGIVENPEIAEYLIEKHKQAISTNPLFGDNFLECAAECIDCAFRPKMAETFYDKEIWSTIEIESALGSVQLGKGWKEFAESLKTLVGEYGIEGGFDEKSVRLAFEILKRGEERAALKGSDGAQYAAVQASDGQIGIFEPKPEGIVAKKMQDDGLEMARMEIGGETYYGTRGFDGYQNSLKVYKENPNYKDWKAMADEILGFALAVEKVAPGLSFNALNYIKENAERRMSDSKESPQLDLLMAEIGNYMQAINILISHKEPDLKRYADNIDGELFRGTMPINDEYLARLEKMHCYYGVYEFSRLQDRWGNYQLIDELIRNFEDPEYNKGKPLCVIPLPREGESGGLLSMDAFDFQYEFLAKLSEKYKIMVFSVPSVDAIEAACEIAVSRAGKGSVLDPQSVLVFSGHGFGEGEGMNLSRSDFFEEIPSGKTTKGKIGKKASVQEIAPFTCYPGVFPEKMSDGTLDIGERKDRKMIGRVGTMFPNIVFLSCEAGFEKEKGRFGSKKKNLVDVVAKEAPASNVYGPTKSITGMDIAPVKGGISVSYFLDKEQVPTYHILARNAKAQKIAK